MKKRKARKRKPKPIFTPPEVAEQAIKKIAERDHTTPEMVRKHLQLALFNGLLSDDPVARAALAHIPKAGAFPTPEEVIDYYASGLTKK